MNWAQHILIFAVRLYQWVLSPAKAVLFGPLGQCRFTPSCSQYAVEAVQTHGALKGSALAAWRVCRCHPWGGCGEDPVPPGKFTPTSDVGVQVQSLKFKVTGNAGDHVCDGSHTMSAVGGRSS